MSAARSVRASEQLVLAGAFEGLTLSNLAAALKDIAGGNDSASVLPAEVSDGGGSLALRNASITLFRPITRLRSRQPNSPLAWRRMPSRGRSSKA